ALAVSAAMIETLEEAGFDHDEAVLGTSLLATWSLGYIVLNDAGKPEAPRPLAPGAGGPDAAEYEQFGIEVILAGLEARLKEKRVRRANAPRARSGAAGQRAKTPARPTTKATKKTAAKPARSPR